MPPEPTHLLNRDTEGRIGFPPPLLGPEPLRLPTVKLDDGLLALVLPGGVLSEAHPFFADQPAMMAGLQSQLRAEKPELIRWGMQVALGINFIEPEQSGILLVGITREGVERWRNALGSGQLHFRYELIAQKNAELGDEIECDLPIARHRREDRMLISHKTGKKARTEFRRIGWLEEFDLWEAETTLPRLHQLRVHAMEVGLKLPGESLYGEVPPMEWSALGRRRSQLAGELSAHPPIHLAQVWSKGPNLPPFSVVAAAESPLDQVWSAFERE